MTVRASAIELVETDWGESDLPRKEWMFRGHKIAYRCVGEDLEDAPALVCVHGFGAHSFHWRKNLPELGKRYRSYAIDLLGFGFSDKPRVGFEDSEGGSTQYDYDYWSAQITAFIREVVGGPCFLVANSIGCVAAMQVAVESPDCVQGVVQFDTSLRLLNVRRRSWWDNITAPLVMKALVNLRFVGQLFFKNLAEPRTLRRVLKLAYHKEESIDENLVRALRAPALLPNALDVFLAFITYDTGPLPEDFLPLLTVPTTIVWGEEDRLEPIKLGRTLGEFETVEDFIVLPNVGHCPQDEAPDDSNRIISEFIERHSKRVTSGAPRASVDVNHSERRA